jgi:glycosyltransferase involved in cell wall biosynthesis
MDEKSVKISIVTVVYNNPLIEEAIDSILAQKTDCELELIVIDGGSTDGTLEALERHRDRLTVFVSERDNGIYDAMNKGISRATGDIVGTLNSDDLYWDENALARIATAFKEDPSLEAVYGDLVYVFKAKPEKILRYWKSQPFSSGLFKKGWMPPHPTFYVRRDVYDRLGLFDLGFKLASDFELTMRFLEVGRIKTRYIHHTIVRMRVGGVTNRISNVLHCNLECVEACKKHGIHAPLCFIPRKLFSKVLQYFRWG